MLRTVVYAMSIGLAFSLYHLAISPVAAAIDETWLSRARGPVFEEAFKFAMIALFLSHYTITQKALIIGLAVGMSETTINTLVVFEDMAADIRTSLPELTSNEVHLSILIGVSFKLIASSLGHGLIVYIALKLANNNVLQAFFLAVVIHFLLNLLLL